jgi:DNA-binding transcriptional regulator YiaG
MMRMILMRSRRTMIARNTPHLTGQAGEKSRKAYTGNNPIMGEEWKQARNSFGYTQTVFGHYFSVHPNTVAKRERDEQDFAHPRLARLAIAQHRSDISSGVTNYNSAPITGAEWRAYLDGLEITPEQFGAEIDAHSITVSKWLKGEVEFPHPNMARLAVRRLYALRGILFPSAK